MFRSKIVKENNTAYPYIMVRHSLLVYHGSTQPTSVSWFDTAYQWIMVSGCNIPTCYCKKPG